MEKERAKTQAHSNKEQYITFNLRMLDYKMVYFYFIYYTCEVVYNTNLYTISTSTYLYVTHTFTYYIHVLVQYINMGMLYSYIYVPSQPSRVNCVSLCAEFLYSLA